MADDVYPGGEHEHKFRSEGSPQADELSNCKNLTHGSTVVLMKMPRLAIVSRAPGRSLVASPTQNNDIPECIASQGRAPAYPEAGVLNSFY